MRSLFRCSFKGLPESRRVLFSSSGGGVRELSRARAGEGERTLPRFLSTGGDDFLPVPVKFFLSLASVLVLAAVDSVAPGFAFRYLAGSAGLFDFDEVADFEEPDDDEREDDDEEDEEDEPEADERDDSSSLIATAPVGARSIGDGDFSRRPIGRFVKSRRPRRVVPLSTSRQGERRSSEEERAI